MIDSYGAKFWPFTVSGPPRKAKKEIRGDHRAAGCVCRAGEGRSLPSQPDDQTGGGTARNHPSRHWHSPHFLPHTDPTNDTNCKLSLLFTVVKEDPSDWGTQPYFATN